MITIKRAGAILAHVSPSELTPTARKLWDARCEELGRQPLAWTLEIGKKVSLWDVVELQALPEARICEEFNAHFLCLRLLRERLEQERTIALRRISGLLVEESDEGEFETSAWVHLLWVRGSDDIGKEYASTLYWDSELSILSALGCW